MSPVSSLLSDNLLYEDFCELLAVAVKLAIALATTLVEYEHLVTLYEWAYYFSNNLCAFYCWSAYSDCAIVNEENLVKFNSCTSFDVLDVVNEDLLAFFNLELLTLNFYDYVHFLYYVLGLGPWGEVSS